MQSVALMTSLSSTALGYRRANVKGLACIRTTGKKGHTTTPSYNRLRLDALVEVHVI